MVRTGTHIVWIKSEGQCLPPLELVASRPIGDAECERAWAQFLLEDVVGDRTVIVVLDAAEDTPETRVRVEGELTRMQPRRRVSPPSPTRNGGGSFSVLVIFVFLQTIRRWTSGDLVWQVCRKIRHDRPWRARSSIFCWSLRVRLDRVTFRIRSVCHIFGLTWLVAAWVILELSPPRSRLWQAPAASPSERDCAI